MIVDSPTVGGTQPRGNWGCWCRSCSRHSRCSGNGGGTLYAPLVYAFGAAVAAHVVLVMNEYFPERWFYYILLTVSIGVVWKVLTSLIRSVARPRRDWLVRQCREAYERFLCPICEYPIRRGPLKYQFWTRRTAKRLGQTRLESRAAESPYTCPMCATPLYEKCTGCGGLRHTLVPACEHCGQTKLLDDIAAAGKARGTVPA